jgi:hypothetical protein
MAAFFNFVGLLAFFISPINWCPQSSAHSPNILDMEDGSGP